MAAFRIPSIDLVNVTIENRVSGKLLNVEAHRLKNDGIELKPGFYNVFGTIK
jgi:hypothetical protein